MDNGAPPSGPEPEPSARRVARAVLRRIRRDNAYSNLALSAELSAAELDGRDRALATELVYGVSRRRALLDHALARHSSRPLHRINDDVLDALRVAAYQSLFLDRVPTHAAVNEAVEAVRLGRGPGVAGFANAVLRKVTADDLTADLPEDPLERLALQTSLPPWLLASWRKRWGEEQAGELARASARSAPMTVRENTLRQPAGELPGLLADQGVQLRPGRWLEGSYSWVAGERPFASASYLDGRWTPQDEAAQLVGLAVAPQAGQTVLDACAGVGGKATHLAALMANSGTILCLDRSPRKLQLLEEHCIRLGVTSCSSECVDLLAQGPPSSLAAQQVLLDAPCTGLGVVRRHPEIAGRIRPTDVDRMAALQRRLLEAVLPAVAPGGKLIYSVCTLTKQEGPMQVRWLLERFPELRLDPAGPNDRLPPGLLDDGTATLRPDVHGTDGFFIARFQRVTKERP